MRRRITPDDRKLEVRIFLAALATGASIKVGAKAVDARVELNIALNNRSLQQAADRYAGDRDRLHAMWMSGELMAIYDREEIASPRWLGKVDLADH